MDVTLFGTCCHVIIMTGKVDPHIEGGARILMKESSIKMIEMCQVDGKARLFIKYFQKHVLSIKVVKFVLTK